jgi:hypothetical protein
VQPLLDAVIAYLPSPLDVPPVRGSEVDNPDVALTRRPDDSETFSALAFKIMADQFVGSLTFLRIYRSTLPLLLCRLTLRIQSPLSGPGPHASGKHSESRARAALSCMPLLLMSSTCI